MAKQKKIIYYDDALHDDFAGTNIQKTVVDETFPYVHENPLWRAVSNIAYYGIAYPLVWFFERVILGMRFVNKEAVKQCKDRSYFLYGNHTGWYDAFTPNVISLPRRRNRIIVEADTVSIPGLRNIVQMLGAIPLPTSPKGMKKFIQAVNRFHEDGNITVYPEAHIWPYYTGVRPFPDSSFGYAVKRNSPVIAFFTAYSPPKGLLGKLRKASITVYVSDPFYPDPSLSPVEARKKLRDQVYAFMLEKSKHSDYEVYQYIPRSQKTDT